MSQPDLLSVSAHENAVSRSKLFEKSPTALRTISEAADQVDVPQHVLRFWETKFTQIKPLKRNGGRRFYRPADIEILQQIKFLLYRQGYTIKGAKKAIDDMVHGRVDPSLEWQDAFPAANVNDNVVNNVVQPLASQTSHIDQPAKESSATGESAKVIKLRTLRSELLSLRDELAPFIERSA
jgi:DNA-binding transcriptional MerR regulator